MHFHLHLFSDTQLHDHVVTSYVAIQNIWIELRKLFLRKVTFTEKSDFLNQARASLRPTRAWFFKIDPVRMVCMCMCVCVCVCVCVRP